MKPCTKEEKPHMKSAPIFDKTVQLIEDRLNILSLGQRVASSNLANLNTPRYVAKEVSFQSALDEENVRLVASDSGRMVPEEASTSLIHARVEETGPVDLEHEMMQLARNSVEYQYMVAMLNKKISLLKTAISEGGN
jgi:flagellar basal-body rod protein FlgB